MFHKNVQSVLIPVNFGLEYSINWLDAYGYKHYKIDVTKRFFRFRQFDPHPNKKKRNFRLSNGIELILEYPNKEKGY